MSRKPAPKSTFDRSRCPVAVTLDTLGDKWSLVVIRDLFFGKRKFSEFLASPEGIKRNILTERLRRLERATVVARVRYQRRPDRYEYRLTRKGADLLPVLQAIVGWAGANVPGVWTPPAEMLAARPERFYPSEGKKPARNASRKRAKA